MHLSLTRNRLQKLVRQKDFLTATLKAVLAIIRTELRMDAYAVLLQACQRQDGVTKQKNEQLL